jgi:hypothetical protein
MSKYRHALAGALIATGLAVAGCSIPSAVASLPTAPASTPTVHPTPGLPPVMADIPGGRPGRYAPSPQWLKADLASRADAYAAMVGMVGHDQTCMADVAHAYRGAVKGTMVTGWDIPSQLHPGKHYVMGPYVNGVCDKDPDLGFYATR